jgi:hypothetical protein
MLQQSKLIDLWKFVGFYDDFENVSGTWGEAENWLLLAAIVEPVGLLQMRGLIFCIFLQQFKVKPLLYTDTTVAPFNVYNLLLCVPQTPKNDETHNHKPGKCHLISVYGFFRATRPNNFRNFQSKE